MVQALIPLKDLVQAKTRLAGLLAPSERRVLAQYMLEDVLTVLCEHPSIERITLLSDDPGATHLCSTFGIEFMPESSLGCRGLNPVLQAATKQLALAATDTLVVLHGDLPLFSAADIDAALSLQVDSRGLVVGCDRHGEGTNLLAFSASSIPEFRFGAGSCARHRAWAEAAGEPVRVLARPGIGLDVDEPADLEHLLSQAPTHLN